MKRRDLEQHLRDHGCEFSHPGGEHDVWVNPLNNRQTGVPRHRKIEPQLARRICKQLHIPPPRWG